MHTFDAFAKNRSMKKSTKILFILFILTFVPSIVLGKFVIAGILPTENGFSFAFGAEGIAGLVLMAISSALGFVLFFRTLMSLPVAKAIFLSSLPLVVGYGVSMFVIAQMSIFENKTALAVRALLNLSPDNIYNTILWAILITIIFVLLLFVNFSILCKPLGKVEKIVLRLGDGKVKARRLKIGGGKQFNNIEHGLNKINNNYRQGLNSVGNGNLDFRKFLPKQIFKIIGKSGVAELELGNQVKKTATVMSVKLQGDDSKEKMSLEENFNLFNAYLNVVLPVIGKFGGFVDKYFGEGVLAVFARAEDALECSHAISRAVLNKNRQNKTAPKVKERISIMTSHVVFGVVGDEDGKTPAIISNEEKDLEKIEKACMMLNSKVVFSGSLLDDLPLNYKFVYRHIGSIFANEKDKISLFEDLEVLPRDTCLKIIKSKPLFERGVLLYENGDYLGASELFAEALRISPNDKGCYVYYNRASEKIE